MENIEIAKTFDEVADLLEIQGANPFRVRAYRNAARTIGTLGTAVQSMLERDGKALEELPGIGADLAGKIVSLCRTGRLPLLAQLTRKIPESLVALLRIPGVGPKRAKLIYTKLGVKTLSQLEKAARAGRVSELRGMGPALERTILRGIEQDRTRSTRVPLAEAEAYIRPLVDILREMPEVEQLDVAGSFRRRSETVGDVDVVVASSDPAAVAGRFLSYPDVKQVLARGDTKCSVVLRSGLQVDLRIVPAASYGSALYYFTGSKAHNIAIRLLGVKRHLKINEYGVFRGRRQIGGRTEAEVFRAVGLPWIPPELREQRGEIEAARAGELPSLVEIGDIRGDLQMHTDATDGRNTLAEMVAACEARGYEYIAITDHTKAVRVAGGLTKAGFAKQSRAIDAIRQRASKLVVLKGAEVDILDDGSLDLDDEALFDLDVVVGSVHSRFNISKAEMTKRIVRALQHPKVHILGHPTGRLLGRREPYPLDMTEVVKAARDYGVLLEVNAQPDRLDLSDLHIRMAKQAGVKLVISTDAHRVQELDCMRYGVDQARRGWCEAMDVANTRHVAAFRKLIEK
ncbi:MAG: DNA polymerase III [Acidobacteria bacterium RIFCSPLOWO2_12_FULL_65_11]|nr:MAG: DNA polymerase III [Acidobacteria bacterium RIFCSPLOWO2_02_FULL_64_15]OFW28886.1 MAG: DNA polymerase III [Acidobacteria bacterium RIFCSPLOWO2_12_FULL_65_11]